MPNDFKKLWYREVAKYNRLLHKYEKEGVRFKAPIIEEDTAKTKYTQQDVEEIRTRRLKMFDTAELYDVETGVTYKGKEAITSRVSQRAQQYRDMRKQYAIQSAIESDIKESKTKTPTKKKPKKILVEARPTQKIADLGENMIYRLWEMVKAFDPFSVGKIIKGYWDAHRKDELKQRLDAFFINLLEDEDRNERLKRVYISVLPETLTEILYNYLIFWESDVTKRFLNVLSALGSDTINIDMIRDDYESIEQAEMDIFTQNMRDYF